MVSFKVKPNDLCPCGTGQKYKRCCSGKIDWPRLLASGGWREHLSIRGRNIHFISEIANALQLDGVDHIPDLDTYKSAFTADAVRRIHEAVVEVWPPHTDLHGLLERTKGEVAGLYIGDYAPLELDRAIVRHSVYASKILLVDPFLYAPGLRDEYNPIENPSLYRAQTLKNVNLYIRLAPWIDAGIVEVIRTPGDFNPFLKRAMLERQREKFKRDPELSRILEECVAEAVDRDSEKLTRDHLLLSAPDEYIRRTYRELDSDKKLLSEDQFMAFVEARRRNDPDFLGPAGPSERRLLMMFSGTNYEMARITAAPAGAYLFTDLKSRWAEIEADRQEHNAENKVWSPFAKAIQDVQLNYLNGLDLKHALQLRKEGRLHELRAFLQKVWKAAQVDQPFSEVNAHHLASELTDEVRKSEAEWEKIKTDAPKMVGAGVVAAAALPFVVEGGALFAAAAVATVTAGSILHVRQKAQNFKREFPAAFFMKLKNDYDK